MECTEKPMEPLLPFPGSETDTTSRTTLDPAGIVAPLAPEMVFVTVATKRSPGRFAVVQIRCPEAREKEEPAAMDCWVRDCGLLGAGCCSTWLTGCSTTG